MRFSALLLVLLVSHADARTPAAHRCAKGLILLELPSHSFFSRFQWAPLATASLFEKAPGVMDPEVIRDLEAAYHRHFEGEEPRPGQVALSGLKSYRPSDQEEFLSGLKETTRHTIDKWAETVLKNAEDFTGAALEIKTVTLGYGFSANRGEGPLIHVDSDTFLHGLTTLRGQSAIIFPRGRAYRFYSLALESQEQPKVLLKKFPENGSGVPLVLKDGIQFGPGQTVLISGTEFERDYIGAKGTWHSSPAEVAPNRLSLFVAIRKRALSK